MTASAARPLGIRADLSLTDEQLAALARLAAFDLEPTRRALRRGVLPAEWVDEAVFEFRRFVGLHIVADEPFAMVCQAVDEVWHTCLLSTRLYARLCEHTLGCFLHHRSAAAESEDGGDDDEPELPDSPSGYHVFARQYQRTYGPLTRMWKFPVLWWDPKRAHLYRPAS
ncbi:MAG: hypothetical protein L0K86_04065 [Actinomycetia bacterium]|nr:hypothetical protein [Actinomycetes bacterium]